VGPGRGNDHASGDGHDKDMAGPSFDRKNLRCYMQ
jgi:hypothetical protein